MKLRYYGRQEFPSGVTIFLPREISTPKANRNSLHNSNKQRLFDESKSLWRSPANSFFLLNKFDPVQTIHKVLAVVTMETHHSFCTANQTHNIITQYLHGTGPFLRGKLNFGCAINSPSIMAYIMRKLIFMFTGSNH